MLERLSLVDELSRADHYYLSDQDHCYYYGEYTAGKGRKSYAHSPTNQLIANLKKPVDRRGLPEWRYKGEAIDRIARAIARDVRVEQVTFIPVPPSKAREHPEYDDRVFQILARCRELRPETDFRELITQTQTTVAAHETGDRPTPAELEAIYTVNQIGNAPLREYVIVLDDVLTTGCHFVAIRNTLLRVYPAQHIAGIFVARRVPEAPSFGEIT